MVGGGCGILPGAGGAHEGRTVAEHICGSKCFELSSTQMALIFAWQLQEGMRWARSQDAHRLKDLAGSLLSEIPDTQYVLSRDTKSDRGFNHKTIGRLLVPVHLLKAYDLDPVS